MRWFSASVSGLQTSQRALEIISNNIANANTPGYHRQIPRLVNSQPYQQAGFSFGTGVVLQDISRIRSRVVEAEITRVAFESGEVDARLGRMRLVETQLVSGDSSIGDRIEALFNRFEELTAWANDRTFRKDVINTGVALTDGFNRLAADLHRLTREIDSEVETVVKDINTLTGQIAKLNGEIQRSENREIGAHDLRDQRDQLINNLAGFVNVRVLEEQNAGQSTVSVGGAPLVAGKRSFALEVNVGANGATANVEGFTEPADVSSGRLGGLLQIRNVAVPEVLGRLDTLARELARSVDAVHTTGIGIGGPLVQLSSQRPVSDVTVPLQDADLDLSPQAGSLFMGVTNLATGSRALTEIDFDPSTSTIDSFDPGTHSLQHVADAIRNVTGIANVVVSTQTGSMTILADAGYGFDFIGGFDADPTASHVPNAAVLTGTQPPDIRIGGTNEGTINSEFTFRFMGPGTIGQTPGLLLEVTDQSGSVISTLDVGERYEPDSPLDAGFGLTVQLSAGDVNLNDSFTTRLIGQPDTGGILTALGLNTFFAGSDAGSIGINPELLEDSDRLASSLSGEVGDTSNLLANLLRLAALRDEPLLTDDTQTYREFFIGILTDVGSDVQNLSETQDTQQLLAERLETERQGLSGVDPNEELVHMLQYQRMFQFAAQQISVVNEALDSLIQIV